MSHFLLQNAVHSIYAFIHLQLQHFFSAKGHLTRQEGIYLMLINPDSDSVNSQYDLLKQGTLKKVTVGGNIVSDQTTMTFYIQKEA